ncbi:MAG: hypothetical protein WBA16_12575 [Nonlabens sp.]
MSYLGKKLLHKRIWGRLYRERLSAPLHLNLISLFVAVFGTFRNKVAYDLVLRPQHAYSILKAADYALEYGIKKLTLIEFGVASGSGLINLAKIAKKVTTITGVEFKIIGLDSGTGMPAPKSYKDHPEYYLEGDFSMNEELLKKNLPENVHLIIGDVSESLASLEASAFIDAPIAFACLDLDYYSSTVDALELFKLPATNFLPLTFLYVDDITLPFHNSKCGELLAIKEFNQEQDLRQIERHDFLVNERLFPTAPWVKQIFHLHVLDHPIRNNLKTKLQKQHIYNPYLKYDGNKEKFNV